jgi:hypothetical protein
VFLLVFANHAVGTMLPVLTRNGNLAIIAFGMAVNRVGEEVFGVRETVFMKLSWPWPVGYVLLVCLISLALIGWRARRAEMAV